MASRRRWTSPSGIDATRLVEQLVDPVVVFELAANPHRLAERYEDLLFDLAVEVVVDFFLLDGRAFSCRRARRSSIADDLLDGGVGRIESRHGFLGHFLRAGFDHHDAVLAAGDDEIERALFCAARRWD